MYILINFSRGLGGFRSNVTFVGMLGPCPWPWPKCMNMHWPPLVCIYIYIYTSIYIHIYIYIPQLSQPFSL